MERAVSVGAVGPQGESQWGAASPVGARVSDPILFPAGTGFGFLLPAPAPPFLTHKAASANSRTHHWAGLINCTEMMGSQRGR